MLLTKKVFQKIFGVKDHESGGSFFGTNGHFFCKIFFSMRVDRRVFNIEVFESEISSFLFTKLRFLPFSSRKRYFSVPLLKAFRESSGLNSIPGCDVYEGRILAENMWQKVVPVRETPSC